MEIRQDGQVQCACGNTTLTIIHLRRPTNRLFCLYCNDCNAVGFIAFETSIATSVQLRKFEGA